MIVFQQPERLTQVLEYSNLFFSVLFAVEMLLKIVADGPFGYIRDGFNVFDGFIVVLRFEPESIIRLGVTESFRSCWNVFEQSNTIGTGSFFLP